MTFADALKYTLSVDGVRMYHPDSSLIWVDQVARADAEDTYEAVFNIIGNDWVTTEHRYTFYIHGSEFKILSVDNPITVNQWFMNLMLSETWACTTPDENVVVPYDDDSWALIFDCVDQSSATDYFPSTYAIGLEGSSSAKLMYKIQAFESGEVTYESEWTPFRPGTMSSISTDFHRKVFIKSVKDGNISLYGCRLSISAYRAPAANCNGNLMSLLYSKSSDPVHILPADDCFKELFYLRSCRVDRLDLPATVLTRGCYEGMFRSTDFSSDPLYGPGNVINGGVLPATELPERCYNSMFCDTEIHGRPVTLYAEHANMSSCSFMYSGAMFYPNKNKKDRPGEIDDEEFRFMPNMRDIGDHGCNYMFQKSNLVNTGTLFTDDLKTVGVGGLDYLFNEGVMTKISGFPIPEGTVYDPRGQYIPPFTYLFSQCKQLVEISPETKILNTEFCRFAFDRCSSLTTLPEGLLPTTTFTNDTYYEGPYYAMFAGCSSLTTLPEGFLPATTLVGGCYGLMFQYCDNLASVPKNLLPAERLSEACYFRMFEGCSSLTTLPEGFLPATTLANSCYEEMFQYCDNLASVPKNLLPAERLSEACYRKMFSECYSLTVSPDLPADTLAYKCYEEMFSLCTALATGPSVIPAETLPRDSCFFMFCFCYSLVTAPEMFAQVAGPSSCCGMFSDCVSLKSLPQRFLAEMKEAQEACFYYMFYGCTSLEKAPALPAMHLGVYCYNYMFAGCTLMTGPVVLPARQLADRCYAEMFSGCMSLTEITVGFTEWYQGDNPNPDREWETTRATYRWVENVGTDIETGDLLPGTFTCPTELIEMRGDNAIPEIWDVVRVTP